MSNYDLTWQERAELRHELSKAESKEELESLARGKDKLYWYLHGITTGYEQAQQDVRALLVVVGEVTDEEYRAFVSDLIGTVESTMRDALGSRVYDSTKAYVVKECAADIVKEYEDE